MFMWLLNLLDTAWKGLPKTEVNSLYRKAVLAYAWYYGLQLGLFRLLNEIAIDFKCITPDAKTPFEAHYFQIIGTLLGGMCSIAFVWWRRTYHYEKRDSMRMVLNWSALFFCIGVVLNIAWFAQRLSSNNLLSEDCFIFSKFLIGFGWAAGIGGSVVALCEILPPSLKTSGIIFVGIVGFGSASVVSLVGALVKHGVVVFYVFLGVAFLISVVGFVLLSRHLPEDSTFNETYKGDLNDQNSILGNAFSAIRKYFKKIDLVRWRLIVCSFLIGISVQGFTFYVRYTHDIKLPDKVKVSYVFMDYESFLSTLRYGGMFVGGFVVFWLCYRQKKIGGLHRKRIPMLVSALIAQFIFTGVLLLGWSCCPGLFNTYIFAICSGFLSGFLGSTWTLSLLTVAEQFSNKDRVWILLMCPGVFRSAEFILLLRTQNKENSPDTTLAVLLWIMVFIFVGIIAALGLNDHFESDVVNLANREKISDESIRKKIKEIKESADLNVFLEQANEELQMHLFEKLKYQIYCNAIYHQNDEGLQVTSIKANELTHKIYCLNKKEENNYNQFTQVHLISRQLIEDGCQKSLISELLDKRKDQQGALLWYDSRGYTLSQYMEVNKKGKYEVINLANVPISNETVQDMHQTLLAVCAGSTTEFEKLRTIPLDSFEETNTDFDKYQTDEKLLQLFAFYRIDAHSYRDGNYFLHLVRPYINPSMVLMLKTVVALSEDHLDELHTLISFIQMEADRREELRRERSLLSIQNALLTKLTNCKQIQEIQSVLDGKDFEDFLKDGFNADQISVVLYQKEMGMLEVVGYRGKPEERYRNWTNNERFYWFPDAKTPIDFDLALHQEDDKKRPVVQIWKWANGEKTDVMPDNVDEIIINDAAVEFYQKYGIDRPKPLRGDYADSFIFQVIKVDEEPIGLITLQNSRSNAFQLNGENKRCREAEYLELLRDNIALAVHRISKMNEIILEKQKDELQRYTLARRFSSHFIGNSIGQATLLVDYADKPTKYLDSLAQLYKKLMILIAPSVKLKDELELMERYYVNIHNECAPSFKKPTIKITSQPVRLDNETANTLIPPFMLLNVLNNSIEHNKCTEEFSEINVEIQIETDHTNSDLLTIRIADDALGNYRPDKGKGSIKFMQLLQLYFDKLNEIYLLAPHECFSLKHGKRTPPEQGYQTTIKINHKFIQ